MKMASERAGSHSALSAGTEDFLKRIKDAREEKRKARAVRAVRRILVAGNAGNFAA